MFDNLTPKNALLYAMQQYDNPQCMCHDEFAEDFKRFKYVKRLCKRYLLTNTISERLMLNHLILLSNVFGIPATVRLLFLRCSDDERLYRVLKPFLVYLNMLPPVVWGVNGKDILTDKVPNDKVLQQRVQAV